MDAVKKSRGVVTALLGRIADGHGKEPCEIPQCGWCGEGGAQEMNEAYEKVVVNQNNKNTRTVLPGLIDGPAQFESYVLNIRMDGSAGTKELRMLCSYLLLLKTCAVQYNLSFNSNKKRKRLDTDAELLRRRREIIDFVKSLRVAEDLKVEFELDAKNDIMYGVWLGPYEDDPLYGLEFSSNVMDLAGEYTLIAQIMCDYTVPCWASMLAIPCTAKCLVEGGIMATESGRLNNVCALPSVACWYGKQFWQQFKSISSFIGGYSWGSFLSDYKDLIRSQKGLPMLAFATSKRMCDIQAHFSRAAMEQLRAHEFDSDCRSGLEHILHFVMEPQKQTYGYISTLSSQSSNQNRVNEKKALQGKTVLAEEGGCKRHFELAKAASTGLKRDVIDPVLACLDSNWYEAARDLLKTRGAAFQRLVCSDPKAVVCDNYHGDEMNTLRCFCPESFSLKDCQNFSSAVYFRLLASGGPVTRPQDRYNIKHWNVVMKQGRTFFILPSSHKRMKSQSSDEREWMVPLSIEMEVICLATCVRIMAGTDFDSFLFWGGIRSQSEKVNAIGRFRMGLKPSPNIWRSVWSTSIFMMWTNTSTRDSVRTNLGIDTLAELLDRMASLMGSSEAMLKSHYLQIQASETRSKFVDINWL